MIIKREPLSKEIENIQASYLELGIPIRSREYLCSTALRAEWRMNVYLLEEYAEFWTAMLCDVFYKRCKPERLYEQIKSYVNSKNTPIPNNGFPAHVAYFYDNSKEHITFSTLEMLSDEPLLIHTMMWLMKDELYI